MHINLFVEYKVFYSKLRLQFNFYIEFKVFIKFINLFHRERLRL